MNLQNQRSNRRKEVTAMFFPGETVTHRFVIPFNANEINHVILSYRQDDRIILEKTITSDYESLSGGTCAVATTLTQQEGLLFADNAGFTVQVNVYTKEGTRHSSFEVRSKSGIQTHRNTMKEVTDNA